MLNNLAKRRLDTLGRVGRVLAVTAVVGVLSACAQHKNMYSWQSYQPSVYAYLKDDGADHATQTLAMEKNIETARATNAELPPGFRAHLGMLYLKLGNGDKGVEQLEGEKAAFPESKPFMDFLLRNASKTAQNTPQTTEQPASSASQAAPADAKESKKGA